MEEIMKNTVTWICTIALLLAALPAAGGTDVMLMETDTLKERLDSGEVVVLDVRTGRDWSGSELKIKGAVRANPRDFDTWSAGLDSAKTIVLYCA